MNAGLWDCSSKALLEVELTHVAIPVIHIYIHHLGLGVQSVIRA